MTDPTSVAAPAASLSDADDAVIPSYLSATYRWAYLDHRTLPYLDRSLVVSAILWGNAGRLMRSAVAEFAPGDSVLQAACVYGPFSNMLAERVGESGALDVIDVAPVQVVNARRKLAGHAHARVRQADLSVSGYAEAGSRDGVCCFFLLHEVPQPERARIVDNLLAAVKPGGKIVFVDYHRSHAWHPLRPVMALVFRWLEPFAASLFESEINTLSSRASAFVWRKTTCFGGLYQKLVGVRRA